MGKVMRGWQVMVGVFAAGLLLASAVEAKDLAHARVSFDGGGGLVKGADEEDWSWLTLNSLILPGDQIWVDEQGLLEIEMAGDNFLRMADSSNAEIVSLPRAANVYAWVGSFYIQRFRLALGQMILETPACQVSIDRTSQVRVDVLDDGATTVTVREGRAVIHIDGERDVSVMSDRRVYIDPGCLASSPEHVKSRDLDAFDEWNDARAELVASEIDAVPPAASIPDDVIGVEDLSAYGDWVEIDSQWCWQPQVSEDFVPYRDGYWSYVPACGYVWVGRQPFSYVTMHYGRWLYAPDAGWFWVYRDGWAPAWAATLRFGSTFVWCPLDAAGRPISATTDCFPVGVMNLAIFAATCCGADDLLNGRCRPFACTPELADDFANARGEIWSILTNNRSPIYIAYNDPALRARNYAPRRAIRGLDAAKPGVQTAGARAATLLSQAPHAERKTQAAGNSNVKTATAPEARSTRARAVHIEAKQVSEASETPRAKHHERPKVTRVREREDTEAPAKDEKPAAPEPVPERAQEQAPSQPPVESAPRAAEERPEAPPPREIRRQAPEPAPPETHVPRAETDSKPPAKPEGTPAPPAPARSHAVESPPAPSSSKHDETSSHDDASSKDRSIRK